MKPKNNFPKIAGLALAGILLSGLALAQGPFGGRGGAGLGTGPDPERIAQFMSNYLGLTSTQQAQAQQIFKDGQTAAEAGHQQLKALRDQAEAAVKAGKSDAELQAIGASVGSTVGNLAGLRLKQMSKFYAILTPEQKTKLESLKDMMPGAGRRFGAMAH
ncbi:MAG: periplasmic heavy metal sensor [Acidobacteria bacterium]|nr:periplasmic heavy metal sensor [Acidobacteriota bacterium]